jgi:hypothetical protein
LSYTSAAAVSSPGRVPDLPADAGSRGAAWLQRAARTRSDIRLFVRLELRAPPLGHGDRGARPGCPDWRSRTGSCRRATASAQQPATPASARMATQSALGCLRAHDTRRSPPQGGNHTKTAHPGLPRHMHQIRDMTIVMDAARGDGLLMPSSTVVPPKRFARFGDGDSRRWCLACRVVRHAPMVGA